MKKLTLLTAFMALFWTGNLYSQTWVEDVYLYDDFGTTGGTTSGSWVDGTLTQGYWTGATQSTLNTFSSAISTANKNMEIKTNVKIGNFVSNIKTFSGTGTPYTSPSGKIKISFICKIGSAQTYSGAYFYFRDNTNKPIVGIGFARINSGGNKWLAVRPTSYIEWQTGATSNYSNITTASLMPTAVDAPALNITIILDFANYTYDMTAVQGTYTPNGTPEWVDATTPNTYSGSNIAFLNNSASNLSNIIFEANGLQTLNSATALNFTFDNFKIAGEKQSSTTGDVVVKYQDVSDNSSISSKSDISHTGLTTGTTYAATSDETANFTSGGFKYIYDSSNSTSSVTVGTNDTREIILKYKVYPIIDASTLTWTGSINGTWNELYSNFTDGTNSLGHQNSNAIIFPASASNKTINLNQAIDLGTNDLTISGTGYNLSTGVSGSIAGTGKLKVDLAESDALTLNIVNNLASTQIAGGNISLSKSGVLGSAVTLNGTSILLPTTNSVSIPASTFNSSATINAGGYYGTSIGGLNIVNGIVATIQGSYNTSNGNITASISTTGNLDTGSGLTLNGTGTTENKFVLTTASSTFLANTNLTLKGNAFLAIQNNQGGATTLNIGTLNGESTSKLGWGASTALDRDITWAAGGSNANSTYAGTITNTGGYLGSGAMYVGNNTNFTKKGTGVLTFSGTANTHNGSFNVDAGELKVTGNIGKSTSTMNVNGGSLTAKEGGIITSNILNISSVGSFVVDATSTANLNTVNVTINGSASGSLNLNDNTTIPSLVFATTSAPTAGTTFQIITANNPSSIIYTNTPVVQVGFSYNTTTGVLTYVGSELSTSSDVSSLSLPNNATVDLTSNNLNIDQNTTFKSLTLRAGSKLNIASTKTLNLTSLLVKGDATGNATLVNSGTVTATNATVQQYFAGARNWYVSAPTSNAVVPAGYTYYGYDETGSNTGYTAPATANWVAYAAGSALTQGKGYIAQPSAAATIQYTGTLNDGDVTVNLTRTAGQTKAGFNLVGNPYPSYLNWDDVVKSTGVSTTMYYRSQTSGQTPTYQFDTYNASGQVSVTNSGSDVTNHIPPMQAFWVYVDDTQTSGTITFRNTMRSHKGSLTVGSTTTNDPLLKVSAATQPVQQVLRLKVSNGVNSDETVVLFNENASDGLDNFDSYKMSNSNVAIPEIYTVVNSKNMVINGFNSIENNKTLPIGFTTGQHNTFTIWASEISNFDSDTKIFLKDNVTGETSELVVDAPYSFSSDITSNTDRFSVIFKSSALATDLKNNSNTESYILDRGNNTIEIHINNSLSEKVNISIYNSLGQKLSDKQLNTEIYTTRLPESGMYMVNVSTAKGIETHKVIIK